MAPREPCPAPCPLAQDTRPEAAHPSPQTLPGWPRGCACGPVWAWPRAAQPPPICPCLLGARGGPSAGKAAVRARLPRTLLQPHPRDPAPRHPAPGGVGRQPTGGPGAGEDRTGGGRLEEGEWRAEWAGHPGQGRGQGCRPGSQAWGAGFFRQEPMEAITFEFQNLPPAGAAFSETEQGSAPRPHHHPQGHSQALRTVSDLQESAGSAPAQPSALGERLALSLAWPGRLPDPTGKTPSPLGKVRVGQGLLASLNPGQGEKTAPAPLGSPSQVRRSRPTPLALAGPTHPVLLMTPRDAPAHLARGDTVCTRVRTGLELGAVVGLPGPGTPSSGLSPGAMP